MTFVTNNKDGISQDKQFENWSIDTMQKADSSSKQVQSKMKNRFQSTPDLRGLVRVLSEVSLTNSVQLTSNEKRHRSKKKQCGILLISSDSPEADALDQVRRRRRRKQLEGGVTFGDVEIREHPFTIGDNPGGYRGPPLAIGWVAQHTIKMSLAKYEDDRPPRRTGAQMNIPFTVREQMLRTAGYTAGEIREALRDVNIARRQRKRTLEGMNLTVLHEFRERVLRGSLNFTLKRGRKKRERIYMKEAWEVHRKLEDQNIEDDEPVDDDDGSGSSDESLHSKGEADIEVNNLIM